MTSSPRPKDSQIAEYFAAHARDFDSIYSHDRGRLRTWRDLLSRQTVLRRLEFVKEFAHQHHPRKVLDIGCGSGRFAVSLARQGSDVIGLDLAQEMLDLAVGLAAIEGVDTRCRFLKTDFLEWATRERFDLTLAIGVFDYVSAPEALMAKAARVTKGHLIASFPRLYHPLVPPRALRLWASHCPIHFFTRHRVRALAERSLEKFFITPFQRDYLLVGRT